jgi:hypothetical protein
MPSPQLLLLTLAFTGGLSSNLACAMASAPPDPAPLAASPAVETRLGDAPVTVELPATAADRLAAVTGRGGHLRLAIDGLQVLHPGAVYQVYLDLPAGQAPDPAGTYFVGNLSLFTEPGQTGDIRRTFDVTDRVKALRRSGAGKGPLKVTFIRERLNGEAGTAGEPPAFLRFTRVSLVER